MRQTELLLLIVEGFLCGSSLRAHASVFLPRSQAAHLQDGPAAHHLN